MKKTEIESKIQLSEIESEIQSIVKLYCARCGKILHPYIYIKNLTHSIILNKEHLLSFCDDCVEKANLEFANFLKKN